jgi:hypothetical protein
MAHPSTRHWKPWHPVNYVQKVRLVSPARYADLEQRLRQQLNKSSINLKDTKQLLATRPEFMQLLRQHAIGAEAFGKQFSDCQTLTDPKRRQSERS